MVDTSRFSKVGKSNLCKHHINHVPASNRFFLLEGVITEGGLKAFNPEPAWAGLAGRRARQILLGDFAGGPSGRNGLDRCTEQMPFGG
jgi:hypothetical protein